MRETMRDESVSQRSFLGCCTLLDGRVGDVFICFRLNLEVRFNRIMAESSTVKIPYY